MHLITSRHLRRATTLAAALILLTFTPGLSSPAQAATTYELMVSRHADRSHAVPLAGRVLRDGPAYIFLNTARGLDLVQFDLEAVGAERASRYEKDAPLDLAGTAPGGLARPLQPLIDEDGVPLEGLYAIRVFLSPRVGASTDFVTSFAYLRGFPSLVRAVEASSPDTVDLSWGAVPGAVRYTVGGGAGGPQISTTSTSYTLSPAAPRVRVSALGASGEVLARSQVLPRPRPDGSPQVVRSAGPARSSPAPLRDMEVWTGDVYAFVPPPPDGRGVEEVLFMFWDVFSEYEHREFAPIFDLAGTAADGSARPFDSRRLVDGIYVLWTERYFTDGSYETSRARVEIRNGTREVPL